ncbi:MAG: SAP domain-containing protein [Nitrospirota bacterium]
MWRKLKGGQIEMKLREIKKMAKAKGIKADDLEKPELVRAIQKVEGNFACYGSANSGFCDQANCLWRQDCLASSA